MNYRARLVTKEEDNLWNSLCLSCAKALWIKAPH
jgi:hypothetical protein